MSGVFEWNVIRYLSPPRLTTFILFNHCKDTTYYRYLTLFTHEKHGYSRKVVPLHRKQT